MAKQTLELTQPEEPFSVPLSTEEHHHTVGLPDHRPSGVVGKRRRFMAKEVLYHEGDPIDRVYVIRSGMVKLLSYLPQGRARIVRLHAHDAWIGLEGLLDQAYEHTAIAVGDVEVEHYSIQSLQRLYASDRRVFGELLHQWHGGLMQADRWIADFSTGGIRPRLARLIAHLAELENDGLIERVELLTVQEMAEILGVTQESVSRVVAGFKRSEILRKRAQSHGAEIYDLDVEKLKREARQ